MQESIFTKIINGEIPSHKVYEDDKTFAFLDIHPVTTGHVLVVPKRQVEFLWDLNDEDYQAVMRTSKLVARHLRESLNVPYVGVKVIGIDVPHAHVQLVPFTTPDEYNHHPDMSAEPDHGELAEVAKKVSIQ